MNKITTAFELDALSNIILNNAFDAIVYYIPVKNEKGELIDFKFYYMNESALNTLTGSKEKYLSNRFLELFPYAKIDGMYDAFKKSYETGEPIEEVFYYKEGEYEGWYRDSIIKYGDGIIVYFRDVTSQKQLELKLKEKTIELEKLVKEKETLLKETHHRIKNNLQIIASMLSLQSYEITDPHYLNLFNVSKQRIGTIALIHQKLYEDRNNQAVDFNNFVEELAQSLLSIYNDDNKKITLRFNIEPLELRLNHSVNIGLIINELLTNCFKYAFPNQKSGEILLTIKEEESKIILIVADNGAGMSKDVGFDNYNSLGLLIVKSLVDQMNGKIEFEDIKKGTAFKITIPYVKDI
ncbi:MAG TPA: histidine kinase dimerization/phosphoacceptor domain -containing protein [Ignavibacteriaceae bacterium]|nr:histidine kinase dimerization/phosphoacceptor domain -containing protein [Ignavibacteriaceae bacterium]